MNENIPLLYLKTICYFYKTKNLSKTAKKLGISQPAVSLQFKCLRDNFKSPIVQKHGQSWELTPYGIEIAQKISPLIDKLENEVRAISTYHDDSKNIVLRVGARKELFTALSFLLEHPGKIVFHDLKSSIATQMLMNNELDIVLGHQKPNVLYIKCKQILSQSTKLIVNRSFAKNKNITAKILLDKNFIYNTPWIFYNIDAEFIRLWFKKAQVSSDKLNVKSEVQDWESIINFVGKNFGAAIIPSGVQIDNKEVLVIEIPQNIIPARPFYLMYHEKLLSNLHLKKLLNVLSICKN